MNEWKSRFCSAGRSNLRSANLRYADRIVIYPAAPSTKRSNTESESDRVRTADTVARPSSPVDKIPLFRGVAATVRPTTAAAASNGNDDDDTIDLTLYYTTSFIPRVHDTITPPTYPATSVYHGPCGHHPQSHRQACHRSACVIILCLSIISRILTATVIPRMPFGIIVLHIRNRRS